MSAVIDHYVAQMAAHHAAGTIVGRGAYAILERALRAERFDPPDEEWPIEDLLAERPDYRPDLLPTTTSCGRRGRRG